MCRDRLDLVLRPSLNRISCMNLSFPHTIANTLIIFQGMDYEEVFPALKRCLALMVRLSPPFLSPP